MITEDLNIVPNTSLPSGLRMANVEAHNFQQSLSSVNSGHVDSGQVQAPSPLLSSSMAHDG